MNRRILAPAALFLLALAAGCTGPMANKAVVARQVEEVLNAGDLGVVDEAMSSEVVIHDLPPGLPPGREGYKALMRDHRDAFSDFHCENVAMVAEGDLVVNRWSWTGVHDKGPYLGIKPTGKRVTMTGMTLHRFAGGKIVEQWHNVDMLGLLRQMSKAPQAAK